MTALARHVARAVLLAPAALVAALALALVAMPASVEAQGPPATEEQAMSIERQLLCPVCTNERLDVCTTAICTDMKRIIRERLAAGATPDDIILYFETRYGERVRAKLPVEGFNLVLYGWIGGSILLVGALGTWSLLGLRRRAQATSGGDVDGPSTAPPPDDAWLDDQIERSRGDGGRD
ncbi:MAG: cytochrome c-type biogenesis protein, partial [Dehalococcoidia bacterium]